MMTSESPEVILVSSGYILGIVYGRQPGKSFIKRRKRSGPSIEPCGTPHLMVHALDKTHLQSSDVSYLKGMSETNLTLSHIISFSLIGCYDQQYQMLSSNLLTPRCQLLHYPYYSANTYYL